MAWRRCAKPGDILIDFFSVLEEGVLSGSRFPAALIKCQVFRCDMKLLWLL